MMERQRFGMKLMSLVIVVAVVVAACNNSVSYAHEVEEEIKESGESWTGWAKEKIQEGLGLKQQGN